MAFAGAACGREADEWALIEWRATRLAMVLSGLDFGGPLQRDDKVGSGDTLMRTIRLVAAALSAMASAKHAASNPLRGAGSPATPGRRFRGRWMRWSRPLRTRRCTATSVSSWG